MAEADYVLRHEDIVTARMPTPTEQQQLDIDGNQPLIVARRRAFDEAGSGRAIEVTLRVINASVHELVYRYS